MHNEGNKNKTVSRSETILISFVKEKRAAERNSLFVGTRVHFETFPSSHIKNESLSFLMCAHYAPYIAT